MPSLSSASAGFASARALGPGLLLTGTIALASQFVSSRYGGPVMLYAILFGIAFNFLHEDEKCAAGIEFGAKRILQLGVVLLGAAVTFGEIADLGFATAFLVVSAVASTIGVGWIVGRLGGLSSAHSVLSAGAVAICGASAAMAIASVLPRDENSERNLVLTVVGVTSLSTIAMILYPSFTHYLELSDLGAGVYLGATIHDVAQVIGAGYIVSDEAGAVAAVVKLLRVTLLAPAIFVIAILFSKSASGAGGPDSGAVGRAFPIFLFGFAAVMIANSIGLLPDGFRDFLNSASQWCLVIAVSALGVKTSLKEVFGLGPAPFAVMGLQTIYLAVFVAVATIAFASALPG